MIFGAVLMSFYFLYLWYIFATYWIRRMKGQNIVFPADENELVVTEREINERGEEV
jgi:hypothetical protein